MTAFLTAAENSELMPRSSNTEMAMRRVQGAPAEMFIRSTLSSHSLQKATTSSREMPFSVNSQPEIRMSRARVRPTRARTRSMTIRGKRARFSRLPPNSSVRWLQAGERNWLSSQPWPQWIITMSNPQSRQISAASAKASATCSISASVISRISSPHSSTKALGPMAWTPLL